MVAVEETITGLLDVETSGVGFFFPNPGVEKDECDGVLCTVAEDMGQTEQSTEKRNVYLELSGL